MNRSEEFRSRGLPAPVFFVLYAGASAVGLAAGFAGAMFVAIEGRRLFGGGELLRHVPVAGFGLLFGALVGGVQSLAVFRASGRGRLWAPATGVGAAVGMVAFLLLFDLAAFNHPVIGLAPMAVLGSWVGLGQWLSVRRAWWLLHVAGCSLALVPWFPILSLLSTTGPSSELMQFVVGPLAAGVVAGIIAASVLWFAIRRDLAAEQRRRAPPTAAR